MLSSPAKDDTLSMEVIMNRCPSAPRKKKRPSCPPADSSAPSLFEGYSSSLLLQQAQLGFADSPPANLCFNNCNESPSQKALAIKPARLFIDDSYISPRNLRKEVSNDDNSNIQRASKRGGQDSFPEIQVNEDSFLRRKHSTSNLRRST